MIRVSELKLPLADVPAPARRDADAPAETARDREPPPHPIDLLHGLAARALGVPREAIARLEVFKRSFDARKPDLMAVYIVDLSLADPSQEATLLARHADHAHIMATPDMRWQPPLPLLDGAPLPPALQASLALEGARPIVVGMGPCGLFAALALARMGLRPIVLERGRPVRVRTRDTWGLWRRHELQAESNVQFGEGGAGLFSDGKLYSQIKDPRHLGRAVMQAFVEAGAPREILYAAHPHIGTFKLVKVVEAMRERLLALGAEVRFEHRVVGFDIQTDADGKRYLAALRVHDLRRDTVESMSAQRVVLALGHSSRDTFERLHEAHVFLEPKPFSVGVRIEHPQGLIDRARWGVHAGHPLLGAADYKLVHHASNGRAVYSFCMCPGGTVVAATSEPGRVVTNGMSQYSRNERNANAGIVVGIDTRDFPTDRAAWVEAFGEDAGARYHAQAQALPGTHPLAGVVLQRQLEARAYAVGGASYDAPGQRLEDFLAGRASRAVGSVTPSYQPGVTPADLAQVLPDYAVAAMREALPAFGRKIRGFDHPDAWMTAVETRTSSPLRITRGDDFQSLNTAGLFPAGEGAGYAGGILSAGVDGLKVAEAVARDIAAQMS